MVEIKLLNSLEIQINTEDIDYLRKLKNYFSDYVENYRFMPQFRTTAWDGKVYLFNTAKRSLPYGLLTDLIKFHKEEFSTKQIKVDEDVKNLFKNDNDYNFFYGNLDPFEYQKEQVELCLKYKKGIIRSATASGKSYSIFCILNTLFKNNFIENTIVIVPTLSLIEQMKSDFILYGIEEDMIGIVNSKNKEFDKKIVVSTWQSLMRRHNELKRYDSFVVDEVHQAKATQLKKILKSLVNAGYRYGFTGTLPPDKLSLWTAKSYIGPILKEYSAGDLAELGYIAKCNIKMLHIKYNDEDNYVGDYDIVKDKIFNNMFRMKTICDIISNVDDNILLLVGKVEKEGEILKNILLKKFPDRTVVFLSGKDSPQEREFWRNEYKNKKDLILVATYGIFSTGINIPTLKYLVFASPFKSKIRILQSIGRALRRHISKEEGAQIFDICDSVSFFKKHANLRLRYYDGERFHVDEDIIYEEYENPIIGILKEN
jgi:superfamily II DNA or RNA helicase